MDLARKTGRRAYFFRLWLVWVRKKKGQNRLARKWTRLARLALFFEKIIFFYFDRLARFGPSARQPSLKTDWARILSPLSKTGQADPFFLRADPARFATPTHYLTLIIVFISTKKNNCICRFVFWSIFANLVVFGYYHTDIPK